MLIWVYQTVVKNISFDCWEDFLENGDEEFAEYIADHPDMSNLDEDDLKSAKRKAKRQLKVANILLEEKKRRKAQIV